MIKIINKILDQMTAVCKPKKTFIGLLMNYILSAHGKLNFRNLSRYGGTSEKTISRNFEKNFNFQEFNLCLINEYTSSKDRLIAVFDPSFIKKSGKHTEGLGKFWNGCAGKAEKGLEIGLLCVVDVNSKTAYALSAEQTISPKDEAFGTTDETRIDAYLKHTTKDSFYLPKNIKHLAVDAGFFKRKYILGVRQQTNLHIVGKMRRDGNLRYLFTGEQNGRGRPKQFDGKFNINDLSKLTKEKTIKNGDIELFSTVINSVSLQMNVKIVVLSIKKKGKVKRVILYSTDLELSAHDIHLFYSARYQIEFLFRDAKQYAGLSDCQARSKKKLHFHFNASFMALNLSKIQYYSDQIGGPFSMASVKSRFYNNALIQCLFANSEIDLSLIKSSAAYQKALSFGAIRC